MRKHPSAAPRPKYPPFLVAIVVVAALGLLAVSSYVDGRVVDAFREPKEMVFRAEALVLLLVAVFAATSRHGRWRDLIRGVTPAELAISAAVVGWTAVTTLTSTNRVLSVESFITVVAAAVIFLATRRAAPELPLIALDICLIPAMVNAVVVTLQEHGIWNPFTFPPEATGHVQSTALLGHPDDVTTYLLGPALAAIVAATTIGGWRRWMYAAVAPVILIGIVSGGARAGIIALLAGLLVFALLRPWKQAIAVVLLIAAGVAIVFTNSTFVRKRFHDMADAARARQYDVLFSERLVPFLTAAEMARQHPLIGVGPGCFKFHYMDERLALSGRYPQQYTKSWPQNFADTHNDHLQVTAESGLPGYALLLAAMLFLAVPVRRAAGKGSRRPESLFAHTLRPPLAAAFFVVALAQFPLQIASTRTMFLTLAALAIGWDRNAG
jgi:O-antigen ligase